MRLRSFLLACTLPLFSCNPNPPPKNPRVWDVSAGDIYRSYRDGSSRWTDQRVRVLLVVGSYQVDREGVYWKTNRPTEPPNIVFEVFCPDDTKTIEITGHVRGKIEDGRWRSDGATWYVVVRECRLQSR